MSFGKQNYGKVIQYREPVDYVVTVQTPSSSNTGLFAGVTLVGIALTLFGTIVFAAPFTDPAPKVHYTRLDLVESDSSTMMTTVQQDRLVKKVLIDFSPILMPDPADTSNAARVIMQNCLPAGARHHLVTLDKSHIAFNYATNYLICAMKTERQRLCNAAHRQKLVRQLMVYRNLREHMFAIERVRDAIASARRASSLQNTFENVSARIEGRKPRGFYHPKISKKVDARIARQLRILVQNGYLSPSDFGFLGLFQPLEFAPYLNDGVIGTSRCS